MLYPKYENINSLVQRAKLCLNPDHICDLGRQLASNVNRNFSVTCNIHTCAESQMCMTGINTSTTSGPKLSDSVSPY